jgi:hypothetical protein
VREDEAAVGPDGERRQYCRTDQHLHRRSRAQVHRGTDPLLVDGPAREAGEPEGEQCESRGVAAPSEVFEPGDEGAGHGEGRPEPSERPEPLPEQRSTEHSDHHRTQAEHERGQARRDPEADRGVAGPELHGLHQHTGDDQVAPLPPAPRPRRAGGHRDQHQQRACEQEAPRRQRQCGHRPCPEASRQVAGAPQQDEQRSEHPAHADPQSVTAQPVTS